MGSLCFILSVLVLLQASVGVIEGGVVRPEVPEVSHPRHVNMRVPNAAQRRSGLEPVGGIPHNKNYSVSPIPSFDGPYELQPDFAGETSPSTRIQIIEGNVAADGQFPWMVGFFIDGEYFCGGSIISENWVLTAGHCVDGGYKFVLTAGSLASENGEESSRQVVTSTTAFRHPDYNSMFVDNDIGIISATFSMNDKVKPVRLPSYSMAMDMMVGKTATISGWGKRTDDENDTISPYLMYIDLKVSDGGPCFEYYGNTWIPNKLCFETKANHKSSCEGDSGGPLVIKEDDGKWTEIGLTSFGALDGCTKGHPIVFTRVASFLDFIETITHIKVRN